MPTNVPLRLYVHDLGMCCVDACRFPPALEDVFLNGTRLTHVVTDGVPGAIGKALEFTVDGHGRVQP